MQGPVGYPGQRGVKVKNMKILRFGLDIERWLLGVLEFCQHSFVHIARYITGHSEVSKEKDYLFFINCVLETLPL